MSTVPMTDNERALFRAAANEKCSRWGHNSQLAVTNAYSRTEPAQVACHACGRTWRLTPDDGEYA